MRYIFITGLIFFYFLVQSQETPSLALNLKIGDKYLIEKDIESLTEQKVSDEVQIIKKTDHFFYEYEIKDIINDSIYSIRIKHLKYRTTIQIQEEISIFDTDSNLEESNTMQEIYKMVLKKDLYIKMTKYGRVLSINNLNQLYEDIIKVTDPDEDVQPYLDLFKYENTEKLAALIFYPGAKIKQKEIWKDESNSSFGILNMYDQTYFIDEIKEGSYHINKNALITSDRTKAVPMNNIYLLYNLKGEMSGNVSLDKNTFMVKESIENQRSEGTVGMKYNINSEPALIWPIIIENKITVKTTKIN